MKCPTCGATARDDAKFCPNCGSVITNPAADSSPYANQGDGFGNSSGNGYASNDYGNSYGNGYANNDYGNGGYSNNGFVDSSQQPGALTPPIPQQSYGYQGAGGVPPVQPGAMRALQENRDIAMYVLLTIVTCGIYAYWYIYQLALDANAICHDDGESTPGLLPFLGLSLITCGFYAMYWEYQLANRLQKNGPRYGLSIQQNGSDVLLWLVLSYFTCGIGGFVAMNIIIVNMNALSRCYNRVNGLV